MKLDDVKLKTDHINGREVLHAYIPNDPNDPFNKTLGWHSDFHSNPVYSAVVYMRVWTVFTQETLADKFDQCWVDIKIK